MKKTWLLTSLSVMFFSFVGSIVFTLFAPMITEKPGMIFDLAAGTSKKTLINDLTQRNLIYFPNLFLLYIYFEPDIHLKTGEYFFAYGSSLWKIWRQVTMGKGLYQHHFVIIPGWSFKQLRDALNQAPNLQHASLAQNDQQIMQQLMTIAISPEGQFFPETYYYIKNSSDLALLKRAYQLMQKNLAFVWQQRTVNLPYQNGYQVLIIASLIEKETRINAERPTIAGVIVNRLRKNMLLQIDPTVIYGLGEHYTGVIRKQDLLTDTPYNTYVHKGLPPTPIALPGMASLIAAVKPATHNYYYFVARGDQEGHQFSATLLQHHAAVVAAAKVTHTTYFNAALVKQYMQKIAGWH